MAFGVRNRQLSGILERSSCSFRVPSWVWRYVCPAPGGSACPSVTASYHDVVTVLGNERLIKPSGYLRWVDPVIPGTARFATSCGSCVGKDTKPVEGLRLRSPADFRPSTPRPGSYVEMASGGLRPNTGPEHVRPALRVSRPRACVAFESDMSPRAPIITACR